MKNLTPKEIRFIQAYRESNANNPTAPTTMEELSDDERKIVESLRNSNEAHTEPLPPPTSHQSETAIRRKKRHPILAIIITVVIVMLVIPFVIQCAKDNADDGRPITDTSHLVSRDATNADISISSAPSLLGNKCTLIPNVDINDLEITFNFYDGNEHIDSSIKYVGDVAKNREYTITFTIPAGVIFNLSVSVRPIVTGGSVSYFD